jgi:rhodanese-related sulfurtransferase
MPRKVDREEVQRLVRSGAQLVDVLPRQEHEEAHLPGSISLPLKELTRERIDEVLRRDRTVIVYCWDFQ